MSQKTPEEIARELTGTYPWNFEDLEELKITLRQEIASAIRRDRKAREWPSESEIDKAADKFVGYWPECGEDDASFKCGVRWLKARMTGGEK